MANSLDGAIDWRSRTKLLYGEEGAGRIASGAVFVAGLGAVGSFAVEALARSGVGRMALVDFDAVEPSNINRQLYALSSTVGKRKCDIARGRVLDINPACEVRCSDSRVSADAQETAALILREGRPDVIVDAIDDVDAKVALILAGLSLGIPVVSSMGAARRVDPSQVRAGGLGEISGCPLAKCVRKALRAKLADGGAPEAIQREKVVCIFSKEPPKPQIFVPEFGPRAMGSGICVTGTFGLVLAAEALEIISRGRK